MEGVKNGTTLLPPLCGGYVRNFEKQISSMLDNKTFLKKRSLCLLLLKLQGPWG
jgi:hypothetical protein